MGVAWGTTSVPQATPELLTTNYATLAKRCQLTEPQVAVGSSAVGEDGQTASFAGQYETYLNIIGAEAVVAAVARCWASARSERVLTYRPQKR